MAEPKAFAVIKTTWFTVQDNFGKAYDAATTREQRDILLSDRDAARDAFYLAMVNLIDETDAYVKRTKADLTAANKAMKDSLRSMQDVVKALGQISEAVKLAAALASMVVI